MTVLRVSRSIVCLIGLVCVGAMSLSAHRLLIPFHPDTSARLAESTRDRTKQPPRGEDRPFHAPAVQTARLDNGVEIFVVERKDLPEENRVQPAFDVSVTLAVRAGATADPVDKAGLSAMTMRMINLGTPTRTALDIKNALGDLDENARGNLDASLFRFTTREYAVISYEVRSRNVAPAFAIFADIAQHASFPESEFARAKTRQLESLAQEAKNPRAVVERVQSILAFGPDHPYGRPEQGVPRTIQRITRDDLVAFHRNRWKPGGAAVVFVGHISLADATKLTREQLGAWRGGAPAEIAVPPPQPSAAGRIYLIDRQDWPRIIVTQFLPGPRRQTANYEGLTLADAVWGGVPAESGFRSRLDRSLRDDKGYSYGAASVLTFYQNAGLWSVSVGVPANKTKESVAALDTELKALAGARPISADELASAKAMRVRNYSRELESYGRLAAQVVNLWVQHLSVSELQRVYDATAASTLDQTRAAAKKYAQPDHPMLLLVGSRAKIEPGLRELGRGPMVILDDEGREPDRTPAKAR